MSTVYILAYILQAIVNKFAEATHLFGLTISIKKTEALHQPSPAQRLPPPSINIDGSELKNVDQFKYLGSMSSDGTLSKQIESWISKTSQSLGHLQSRVMDNRNIKLSTKLKVYKTVVLTSLLYGCETWTLYRKQIKQLEGFHMRSLRRIMDIRWQDKVTNLQALDRANAVSIEALLFKAQLRWTGHVIRMDASRMLRQILYGELMRGTRKKGRPKKRYKDCIKETLKQCSLPPRDLETSAQDRPGWCVTIKSACSKFEDIRRDKILDARARRKASVTTPDEATFQCPHCPRLCASRIGLYSHARTHRMNSTETTSSNTMVYQWWFLHISHTIFKTQK